MANWNQRQTHNSHITHHIWCIWSNQVELGIDCCGGPSDQSFSPLDRVWHWQPGSLFNVLRTYENFALATFLDYIWITSSPDEFRCCTTPTIPPTSTLGGWITRVGRMQPFQYYDERHQPVPSWLVETRHALVACENNQEP